MPGEKRGAWWFRIFAFCDVTTQDMRREGFSTRIIKAGALLEDVKVLLLKWDERRSVEQNLLAARTANILGKVSRSRVEDILQAVRARYFRNNGAAAHLHRLVKGGGRPEAVDRILYYHAALADPLLNSFVTDFLYEKHRRGEIRITVDDALQFIRSATREGRIAPPWSEYTRLRVARGLLSTLRDFRILEGAVRKRFAPVSLPLPAFVYIAFQLRQQTAGIAILRHPDWRLFFCSPGDVDHLFIRAQQDGYVRYEALGEIVRIEFPYESLEEMVHDLLTRRTGDALV